MGNGKYFCCFPFIFSVSLYDETHNMANLFMKTLVNI